MDHESASICKIVFLTVLIMERDPEIGESDGDGRYLSLFISRTRGPNRGKQALDLRWRSRILKRLRSSRSSRSLRVCLARGRNVFWQTCSWSWSIRKHGLITIR